MDIYTAPHGHHVNAQQARAMIRRLAPQLRANGHESAARYVERDWKPIAARPTTWAELAKLAQQVAP